MRWLAIALVCLSAGSASAYPITIAWTGVVVGVEDGFGLLGGSVAVGDAYTGWYTYESTAPNAGVPNSGLARYPVIRNLSYGAAVILPGQRFDAFGFVSIGIGNDVAGFAGYDSYGVSASRHSAVNPPGRWARELIELDLGIDLGDVGRYPDPLRSVALPVVAPNLDEWEHARLRIDGASTSSIVCGGDLGCQPAPFTIYADVRSLTLVPEPGTALLLALGLGLLKRAR